MWGQRDVVLHLNLGVHRAGPVSLPVDFDAQAEDVLSRWNAVEGSFSFRAAQQGVDPCDGADGRNSVVFRDDFCGEPFGDAVAITRLTYVTAPDGKTVIQDTDVLFDGTRQWDVYTGPLRRSAGGVTLDFGRVALHEFGHVLGLSHPDQAGQRVAAIMNATVGDRATLSVDDRAGKQALYPGEAPTSGNGAASGGGQSGAADSGIRDEVAPASGGALNGLLLSGLLWRWRVRARDSGSRR